MKTKLNYLVLISLTAVGLLSLSSCEKESLNANREQYAAVIDVAGDGTTSVINKNMPYAFVETGDLTDTELASLLKMKEEEKLAHDVYAMLFEKYGSNVFSRISNAESNHLNAIIVLLRYYGYGDTLIGEAGVFVNSEIQTLYNDLIAKSSVSIEEAYKTGALIEEMDIKDLNDVLSTITNENIRIVYENLTRGSRNHLRAFNRQLTSSGLTYIPEYLTQDEFSQIVNSPMEKGKQYRMNGQFNGKGKQGKGKNGNGMRGNGTCNN